MECMQQARTSKNKKHRSRERRKYICMLSSFDGAYEFAFPLVPCWLLYAAYSVYMQQGPCHNAPCRSAKMVCVTSQRQQQLKQQPSQQQLQEKMARKKTRRMERKQQQLVVVDACAERRFFVHLLATMEVSIPNADDQQTTPSNLACIHTQKQTYTIANNFDGHVQYRCNHTRT